MKKKRLLFLLGFYLPTISLVAQAPTLAADVNQNGFFFPTEFMEFNGQLYFSANDGIVGEELWSLVTESIVAEKR